MKTNAQNHFELMYSDFNEPNGRIMVIAHRGDWFDAPENSLSAIRNAIALGVDMIELDVKRSKDGQLILMHDDTVDRTTNGSGIISDLTFAELSSLKLKQSQGGETVPLTNEYVPTLVEVMNLVKDKTFVNLDQCWGFREEVYEVLLKTDSVKHALFKSKAELDEVESFLNSKPIRPEYMHIIDHSNTHLLHDPDAFLAKIKPKAIEFIFENEVNPIAVEDAFSLFKGKCRVWINTLWDSLCAGHSDEKSLENAADGWGWGIKRGVNMIQTDYSRPLLNYLQNLKTVNNLDENPIIFGYRGGNKRGIKISSNPNSTKNK